MSVTARSLLALVWVLALAVSGCGDSQPEPVSVSGYAPCVEVEAVGEERNRYECDESLDDPRVSGPSVVTVTIVDFDASPIEMRGRWTLDNGRGAWDGEWTGVIEDDGLHTIEGVFVGSGEYEGLVYRARWDFYELVEVTASGTIEPAP